MRQPAFTSVVSAKRVSSEIRQRVLSARQHRQKNVQNQLNVALKMNAVNIVPCVRFSKKRKKVLRRPFDFFIHF